MKAATRLAGRVAACRALGERVESLADDAVLALVAGPPLSSGWGAAHRIAFDGTPVFVTRIPVTDVERADCSRW